MAPSRMVRISGTWLHVPVMPHTRSRELKGQGRDDASARMLETLSRHGSAGCARTLNATPTKSETWRDKSTISSSPWQRSCTCHKWAWNETFSSSASAMQERLARARRVSLRLPNVTGVGVGWKETRGRVMDVPAWRVYINHKLLQKKLKADHRVPLRLEGMARHVVPAWLRAARSCADRRQRLACVRRDASAIFAVCRSAVRSKAMPLAGDLGVLCFGEWYARTRGGSVSNRPALLAHGAGRGDPIDPPVFRIEAKLPRSVPTRLIPWEEPCMRR